MKIKRLEISGFKSFVEKAIFDFPEGVTAVVGPNGCGKSNVVDAIRWVMGEQSAKNLRGRAMEDVIFGGSESRKPLGMAEVSLLFSTEDGRVPAKYLNYSEIQVTRRLYRDGESEYLLNRTQCRLMDITELFMDTGVGARAYSIIEQGRIGMILMAKPEERRFLIEEAAGVTKYKSRKQIALKKMEATRQNLLRISDIVGEVKRQLGSLHRQAKKAEKFRAVREELRSIDLFFASRRYQELTVQREQISAELLGLERQGEELSSRLGIKSSDIDTLRLQLVEEEQRLSMAQEEIFKSRSALQGGESRLEFQKKEIASLEELSVRLSSELTLLQKQIAEADSEHQQLELKSRSFLVDSLGEEEVLNVKEHQLEELASAERVISLTLEESRKRLFGILGELSQAANQQSNATKRLDTLGERIKRSSGEEEKLKGLLAETSGRVTLLRERVGEEQGKCSKSSEAITGLSATIDTLRKGLSTLEGDLQTRRDELSRVSSRLHSLQELEAQFAGYGQGVRALMLADAYKQRFSGLLADLVDADEEVEAAVEAVLGSRLQSLIASGDRDVMAAVEFLRSGSHGRCSFLLPGKTILKNPEFPDGCTPLLDRVRLIGGNAALLGSLLHNVAIAPDLESAMQLSRDYPQLRFVTLGGDIAYGGNSVIAGAKEGGGQGLIHKKREIKVLIARKKSCDDGVNTLVAEKSRLLEQLATAEKELTGQRQSQRMAEIALVTAQKDLQSALAEVTRFEERISLKALEDGQLLEERDMLNQEFVAAGVRKGSSEELKSGLEGEISLLQVDLAAKRKEIETLRSEATTMKVRAAALKERQQSVASALVRLEQQQSDLARRYGAQSSEMERSAVEIERIKGEVAATEADLIHMRSSHAEREGLLSSLKSACEESMEKMRSEELSLRSIKTEDDTLRKSLAEASLKLSTTVMEFENLEQQLRERYRMEPVEVIHFRMETDLDSEQLLDRQLDLQKQVDEFGEVNLTAIEEYAELEERHNFLATQKADLEESIHALQQAIQRINRTTRKRFSETFDLVNEKFKEIFPRLFCGGKAELRLTNEEDMLETGLDIIVQPPGKKLQNVSLLSGGEKALTAVALIFSIFLIKPSPFCLLDEVDAPLDDANIGRFNDIIREMTAFSQFILITHSKTTMAVADTLYGVTMEEPGVSRLVSVKLQ